MVAARTFCSDYSHSFKLCLLKSRIKYREVARAKGSKLIDERRETSSRRDKQWMTGKADASSREESLTNSIREGKDRE